MALPEYEFIEVDGHKLVAPILTEGAQLCRPIEEYFPDHDPKVWFAMTVEQQDAWVVDTFFNGQCVFFGLPLPGEKVTGHHLIKRSSAKKAAYAPWNVIPLLLSPNPERSAHDWFHRPEGEGFCWAVTHYDPLDRDGGLIAYDEGGKRIPNRDLHFYSIPTPDRVKEAQEWIRLSLLAYRGLVGKMYELGALAAAGEDFASTLGTGTVKACYAQYGIDNGVVTIPRRIMDEMSEVWDRVLAALVPPRIVDMLRNRVPDTDMTTWVLKAIERCSPLDLTKTESRHPSIPDFIQELEEAFPKDRRPVKVSIVPEGTKVDTHEVESLENIEQKGIVFKGAPVRRG